MKLREYAMMAGNDLRIDKSALDEESGKTAQLHGKYLLLYLDETTKLEILNRAFDSLRHDRKLYYLGKAAPEVYKAKPFDLLVKPIKSEVEEFLSADPDIQVADAEIKEQEKIVKFLNDTIKQVNQRGFEIRAMIDWIKFKHGLNG